MAAEAKQTLPGEVGKGVAWGVALTAGFKMVEAIFSLNAAIGLTVGGIYGGIIAGVIYAGTRLTQALFPSKGTA